MKNSLSVLKLKGKVKILTETEFEATEQSGEFQKGTILNKLIILFNNNGNMIVEKFPGLKNFYRIKTFLYDGKSRLIEENQYSLIERFDVNGKLFEDLEYYEDCMAPSKPPEKRHSYKYDEKGNLVDEHVYNSNSTIYSYCTYNYDNMGNRVEENRSKKSDLNEWGEFDISDSVNSKFVFKYDEKGNKIEAYEYYSDGKLHCRYGYKYDENRNKIEEIEYGSGNAILQKHTYKYDSRGDLVEENTSELDGSTNIKFIYQYDDKGNLIDLMQEKSYKLIRESSNTESCKYNNYDIHGNWLYRIKKDTGKPILITEREIEYLVNKTILDYIKQCLCSVLAIFIKSFRKKHCP